MGFDLKMTEVILITGCINSGKSTTAKYIRNAMKRRGHSAAVVSFATPLKELAARYFNYTEIDKTKKRDLLENLATDLKELFGKQLFGYTLLDKCQYLDVDYIIIDDLRYSYEFDIIAEYFASTVIKMPTPKTVDDADFRRIQAITDHFDNLDFEYTQLKALRNEEIDKFIYGIV